MTNLNINLPYQPPHQPLYQSSFTQSFCILTLLYRGAANVRFRRPIRQISFSKSGIRLTNLRRAQDGVRRRATSRSPSWRVKYARKGPTLKRFRPPRKVSIRSTSAPRLNYQKYKYQMKRSKGGRPARQSGTRFQKPLNILERSRLRKLHGLINKRVV